ncbi:hypothetical protein ACFW9U_17375 [Rhodococcus aetherivorans]|uniref:hypothetical protein n=1 Tax=Rhodococcus aetherivorans TaxID=191292 RepID=UPI00366AED8A
MTETHITLRDGVLHLGDDPRAVKAVSVTASGVSEDARYLLHLARHFKDLEHVIQAAVYLRDTPDAPEIVREALWRSAIVTLCLCFDPHPKVERRPLKRRKVFPDPNARAALEDFVKLRNKDIAHDEGVTVGAELLAVLGREGDPDKVLELKYIQIRSLHSSPQMIDNLGRLAEEATTWIEGEYTRVSELVTEELRAQPYDALMALPASSVEVKKHLPQG